MSIQITFSLSQNSIIQAENLNLLLTDQKKKHPRHFRQTQPPAMMSRR
ncbi:hypothetical protein [Nostoc commune]|nr:hypothetical protein [Nostoc commune]